MVDLAQGAEFMASIVAAIDVLVVGRSV